MAFKLASLVVALCVLATVLAAPSPKTVINADDNDVAAPKAVIETSVSSAIEPVKPNHGRPATRPGLFDDIFNIPTSILSAVNRLLNGGGKQFTATASVGDSQVHSRIGGPDSAITPSGNEPVKTGTANGSGIINDIFNIPISALNAVNQLLNNNQKTAGK